MTSKERVLQREHDRGRPVGKLQGREDARDLIARAPGMTGTELIDEEQKIPAFDNDRDYSGCAVGSPVTDEGQVWILLQPYNAANYPNTRPSQYRAGWGLAHTTDPYKAKPWVDSYGTSGLYKLNEVCIYPNAEDILHVFRNLWDNNEYPPLTLNVESRWEDLGPMSEWKEG